MPQRCMIERLQLSLSPKGVGLSDAGMRIRFATAGCYTVSARLVDGRGYLHKTGPLRGFGGRQAKSLLRLARENLVAQTCLRKGGSQGQFPAFFYLEKGAPPASALRAALRHRTTSNASSQALSQPCPQAARPQLLKRRPWRRLNHFGRCPSPQQHAFIHCRMSAATGAFMRPLRNTSRSEASECSRRRPLYWPLYQSLCAHARSDE